MEYMPDHPKTTSSSHSQAMSTYSIAACDPLTHEVGVAVQSKYLAVGAIVPWARAGVGAAASQAATNTVLGEKALTLLGQGRRPEEAVTKLLQSEPDSDRRQLGLVDMAGRSAAHTGAMCLPYAGHITGRDFCCQGNCLVGPKVLEAMAGAFVQTAGDLPERLLSSLTAAEAAGGDIRGSQSAALLVAGPNKNLYAGACMQTDVRVDDHPHPVLELARLLQLHRLYYSVNYIERNYTFGPHLRNVCAAWLSRLRPDTPDATDEGELRKALLSFAREQGDISEEFLPAGQISGAAVHQLAKAYFELEAARLHELSTAL